MTASGGIFYEKNRTFHKRKVWTVFLLCAAMMLGLAGRLVYLMGFRSDYYYQKAQDLHERERSIKAARGKILDARGKVLASNKTVCTVSVIHSQIKEPEKIILCCRRNWNCQKKASEKSRKSIFYRKNKDKCRQRRNAKLCCLRLRQAL